MKMVRLYAFLTYPYQGSVEAVWRGRDNLPRSERTILNDKADPSFRGDGGFQSRKPPCNSSSTSQQ